MTERQKARLIAIAYHEAGHAVMTLHLGLRVGRLGVSIVAKDDYNGYVHTPLGLGG